MIPPSVVKRFLARNLADNRYLKDYNHDRIERLLDNLPEPPSFWSKLMLHQKVCLYLGIKYKQFAFWCDMGSGKTLVALELLSYWYSLGCMRRALVFVTSDKAFSTWEKQIRRYRIEVPFISLDEKSSAGKWEQLKWFKDGIVLLHYPGTVAMVTEKARSRGKKNKFVIADDKLDKLLAHVDALVLDESTKCANHRSLTYQICLEASYRAKYRYALAGMPFGRDPAMLWPQMNLIDHGETLGQTLGIFREAFFTKSKSFWGKHHYDYKFKKSLEGVLKRTLQNRSITYPAEECIEVPQVSHIVEEVRLSKEILEYYEAIVNELVSAKGNMRAMKNAFLRMRQLSSGFIGLKDDETGDKAEMDFDENPKLDRLMELIEELPVDRKCLIFYQYTHSGRNIAARCYEEGHKTIWLWSGTKNAKGAMASFIESKDCNIAIINNQVGAYSLDGLQVANYEFHYESAVSVIDRTQAEKRIIRTGQTRKCFIYDLVARDTVDSKILDYHAEGHDLVKALLADPRKVLGVAVAHPKRH